MDVWRCGSHLLLTVYCQRGLMFVRSHRVCSFNLSICLPNDWKAHLNFFLFETWQTDSNCTKSIFTFQITFELNCRSVDGRTRYRDQAVTCSNHSLPCQSVDEFVDHHRRRVDVDAVAIIVVVPAHNTLYLTESSCLVKINGLPLLKRYKAWRDESL